MLLQVIAVIIASIFFLAGLVGTVVPILPGAPLILLGMLVYGLIAGFENLSVYFFIGQGMLAIAVMGVDYVATALGGRFFGGSRAAFWGASLGLILGLIFFNIPGLLIGPFVCAVAAELIFRHNLKQALRSGLGSTLGLLGGIPVKLVVELIMITWFVIAII